MKRTDVSHDAKCPPSLTILRCLWFSLNEIQETRDFYECQRSRIVSGSLGLCEQHLPDGIVFFIQQDNQR